MNKFKTPYYLIDKEELNNNFEKMRDDFKSEWDNLIIGYSFKTNSLPWVINFFKKKGAYAEVVSKAEYKLAKHLGYDLDKIIYNGPIKSEETFIEALENSAIVNIDSFQEVEWIKKNIPNTSKKWKIGIRINFDLESYCPGETSCGLRGGRFGFNYENGEVLKVISELKEIEYVKINGIHLHNSTKTRSLNIYKNLAKMAVKLKELFPMEIEYIDIGGGFFGGLKNKPQYIDYAKTISKELKKNFSANIYLIIEPGAALIASPISFISKVISVKKVKETKIVTIDGSCNNLNPLMRDKSYFYEIYSNKKDKQKEKKQIVAGYTCMENDILLNLENEKELLVGDLIRFNKVGSYTSTLSPLFIEYFPNVIVKDNKKYFYARKEWEIEEFIQKNYTENEEEIIS